MPELKVIEGGGGSPPKAPKPAFREHPLAIYLWKAIYPHPATTYTEIAQRMSDAAEKKISFYQANNCIHHVRSHPYDYGWTIGHVRKGPGHIEHRKYFPVLVDADDHKMRVSDFRECLRDGAISSSRTIASMAEHEAAALEAAASSYDYTPVQKRKMRAVSSMFTAASRMAEEVLGEIASVA